MIIDAHQHFWQYDPARMPWIAPGMDILMRDWLPDDLAAALAAHGIDATIAVQASGDEAETEFLLKLAATWDWIAGVVGWLDLQAPQVQARIEHWRAAGPLVGVRHQLEDAPALFDDARFDAGVTAVQQQELVYEVLARPHQLDAAIAFCARHDRHTLVVDHLAKPAITGTRADFHAWRRAMAALAAMPHVAVKLSGLATEAQTAPGQRPDVDGVRRHMDAALELFGADRLLYGSDWPVCRLATTYDAWFAQVEAWVRQHGDDCRRQVLGANAEVLYQLKRQPGCCARSTKQ